MNILLSNDDGIHAAGILTLAKRLSVEGHKVFVVAPEVERSGCSHSITLRKPLSAEKSHLPDYGEIEAYSVDGTPADCVKIAVDVLIKDKIDLILSGINIGSNLGTDVAYSGTVNAALEGCICGYPSMALSQNVIFPLDNLQYTNIFAGAADITAQLIEQVDLSVLKEYIYNINFPAIPRSEIKGIKVCETGISWYDSVFKKQEDPFGREHYWIYAENREDGPDAYNNLHDTDVKWVRNGYITITPLTWNRSCHSAIQKEKCKMKEVKLHF